MYKVVADWCVVYAFMRSGGVEMRFETKGGLHAFTANP